MNLERNSLENMLDESLRLHILHPEDEILRDTFNNEQLLYREVHGKFYKPAQYVQIELDIDYEDDSQFLRSYN